MIHPALRALLTHEKKEGWGSFLACLHISVGGRWFELFIGVEFPETFSLEDIKNYFKVKTILQYPCDIIELRWVVRN